MSRATQTKNVCEGLRVAAWVAERVCVFSSVAIIGGSLLVSLPAWAGPARFDGDGVGPKTECAARDLQPAGATGTNGGLTAPPTLTEIEKAAPYRQLDKDEKGDKLHSIRQSALSLGMRAGFNRGIWCEEAEIRHNAARLDRMFDFRSLLFDAGGGYMFEPGIVTEQHNVGVVSEDGTRAASVADRVELVSREHLVRGPRSWRQYLLGVDITPLAPEAPENRPTDDMRDQWNAWVAEGWRRGLAQASENVDVMWNMLERDYLGMIGYRRMLLEGKLRHPRAVITDRGVTGGGDHLQIDDVEVDIARRGSLEGNTTRWHALPFAADPSAPAAYAPGGSK
jgi:hypothetical protein